MLDIKTNTLHICVLYLFRRIDAASNLVRKLLLIIWKKNMKKEVQMDHDFSVHVYFLCDFLP